MSIEPGKHDIAAKGQLDNEDVSLIKTWMYLSLEHIMQYCKCEANLLKLSKCTHGSPSSLCTWLDQRLFGKEIESYWIELNILSIRNQPEFLVCPSFLKMQQNHSHFFKWKFRHFVSIASTWLTTFSLWSIRIHVYTKRCV